MLEFEALGIPRVRTELSAQYVDHNLLQEDFKNANDHLFLRSACKRFGLWYSRPGNGVSHPLHMERFGVPGKTLLGSDSHTCSAGSWGMLAIGAGVLEVTMAMAGEPFYVKMPKIWGVKLVGELPDWVSAKDVGAMSVLVLGITMGAAVAADPAYLAPVAPGWRTRALITVGESVNDKPDGSPYRMVGIPDGLGAYDNHDGTFTVLMNHELREGAGVPRAHGGIGAFVSQWTIRKPDLKVLHGGDLIKQVYLWDPGASAYVLADRATFSQSVEARAAPAERRRPPGRPRVSSRTIRSARYH